MEGSRLCFLLQIAILILFSAIVKSKPLVVMLQWFEVSKFFMTGMYTFTEILFKFNLGIRNSSIILPMLLLLSIFFLCWHKRDNGEKSIFFVLCFVSIFWMYHGSYDFVILVFPLQGFLSPYSLTEKY